MPDAQHWRDRVEAVRASAEAMHDPVAGKTLLKIAEDMKSWLEAMPEKHAVYIR